MKEQDAKIAMCILMDIFNDSTSTYVTSEHVEEAIKTMKESNRLVDSDCISDVIETLKAKLEINAGRLAEPLLKQGKQPKDDKECHKAFLMMAHLSEIEEYLSSR